MLHFAFEEQESHWNSLAILFINEFNVVETCSDVDSRVDIYQVVREGFSHPSMNGIMLWTALHANGCYQMCLTDYNLQSLPAGDVVDNS
ncbi:putative endo-1,4-beta-xylanase [Rosa chinensis]|uniref:Putative endo-1,4-beta-xylanase n=1 Tax=Rosa chinensis TaxID=74649 RepID=A0A2P6PIZ6_ROSCH|nr:putative endo-1,4-beta-xylanase [Rosa chinensis]